MSQSLAAVQIHKYLFQPHLPKAMSLLFIRWQVGLTPDHISLARHLLTVVEGTSSYPFSQSYTAIELNVVDPKLRFPFSGRVSGPQSATVTVVRNEKNEHCNDFCLLIVTHMHSLLTNHL